MGRNCLTEGSSKSGCIQEIHLRYQRASPFILFIRLEILAAESSALLHSR
jgi:hypothetical protein